MKKKLLSLMLVLAMMLSMLPVTANAANIAEGSGWYLDARGCLHLTGAISHPSDAYGNGTPWREYKQSIKSVVAEPGSSVNTCAQLFRDCSELTSVDLHALDTSAAPMMTNMFYKCAKLTSVNLKGIDTSNVTRMDSMFYFCSSLNSVDMRGLNTANVTDVNHMFFSCSKMETVYLDGFNTGALTNMSFMFAFCSKLKNLDLRSFDGSALTSTENFLLDCDELVTLGINQSLLAKTADYLVLGFTKWTNKDTGEVYASADDLRAITGAVMLVKGYNPFTDVKAEDFFYTPLQWALWYKITNGIDATHFGPGNDCLRAQVVTFLWRTLGSPDPMPATNPFVDVKESDFYYKPVLWAVENGITSGMDATHFGPMEKCNRAQVVTFLYRAAGSPSVSGSNPFKDVPAGSFYETPVLWAVENGITNGMDATHFGPTATCNRAQIVTFLYRDYFGKMRIYEQPHNVAARLDQPIQFAVFVVGGKPPYTYSWRIRSATENGTVTDWFTISSTADWAQGANTNVLKLRATSDEFAEHNEYSCKITDANGTTLISAAVWVTPSW